PSPSQQTEENHADAGLTLELQLLHGKPGIAPVRWLQSDSPPPPITHHRQVRYGSSSTTCSEAPEDHPLDAAGKDRSVQVSGELGLSERAATSETRGAMLAAPEPGARPHIAVRGILRSGEGASEADGGASGRVFRGAGGGYDNGGRTAHVPDHDQHAGWGQGRDRCQPQPMGRMD
ncbi:hypothetical protein F2P56_033746, partial [Juglans regia]